MNLKIGLNEYKDFIELNSYICSVAHVLRYFDQFLNKLSQIAERVGEIRNSSF